MDAWRKPGRRFFIEEKLHGKPCGSEEADYLVFVNKTVKRITHLWKRAPFQASQQARFGDDSVKNSELKGNITCIT